MANKDLSGEKDSTDAAYVRGVGLLGAGNLGSAMEEWRHALAGNPQHAPSLYNLAVGSLLQGDSETAEELYRKLLEIQPAHREGLYNFANLLMRTRRYEDATSGYRKLIGAHPDFMPGLINAAMGEAECGRLPEAETLLRRAISKEPDNVSAHWNLSHILLAQHHWQEAWQEYEWRLKRRECPNPPLHASDWPQNNPSARRILLWNDQGLGDALQFLRYAAPLAEQGHEVYVLVQDALKKIASTARGVTGVFSPSDPLPEMDAQAPLLSMPHRLSLFDPRNAWHGPYLKAPAAISLPRQGKRAIGIAWAGNPEHPNDALRSARLADLAPLFNGPDTDWFSLQVGPAVKQIAESGLGERIFDLSPQLKDFSDTAAAMASLDLIITVDTAVAHLAGALGCSAFVMLAPIREWRWVGQEKESLWYPSLRLLRQQRVGDWREVVSFLLKELSK